MTHSTSNDARPHVAIAIIATIAAIKVVAHVGTNLFGPYEFHRDEFLYMAMGRHLHLWHMDFPPLIAMLSEVTRGVLGDSLVAIRLPPALMSTALVVLAALTARELGGGRWAQGLAALAVFGSGLFLRSGNLFQPVVIDQLWWAIALFALVKLCRTENPRWWLAYGTATGLGLLSKFSVLILGVATLLALVATPSRRWLRTRWPWIGGAVAFVIGSPSVVGQIALDFPVFLYMGDLANAQLSRVSPLAVLLDQPTMFGGFVLAAVGAVGLGFHRGWAQYRLVGWTCLISVLLFLLLRGKSYYLGPVYPTLFGAGAVMVTRIRAHRWNAVTRWGIATMIVMYTAVLFPLGLPVLPPDAMERYLVALGMQEAAQTNIGNQERIPQDYADMLNWEEQVGEVARVYHALPADERDRAVILASNYGEAGAIDFYGPKYGLPSAVAFVGTYWLFGPGPLSGEVVILHGFDPDDFSNFCGSVERAGFVTHPFAVEEQRNQAIYVCRDPRETLQELWPRMKGEV